MAVELATGYINLVPSATGIGAAIAKELGAPLAKAAQDAGADASKRLGTGLLSGAADTGKKLLAALGLAAVGAFAFKAAVDVEDANNIIVRATGATGKALEGLQASFRNVASSSGASFEVISTTLAELNQRTGLTGKALEALTSEVVSFNRITKDAPITVQSLTTALAGFNVPGREMGKVLDHLFIISQKTGVPLSELLSTLQTAGPVARQFGFSVEFTAGFLAQLNKVGVDSNSVVSGLRRAFVEFAKDGREPAAALRETLSAIDDLVKKGDSVGARQLAVQLFGPRGTGLVDAALSGKLSLQSLGQTVDVTGDGILDTAKKTGTLSGAMGILRNNLKLALAEFATPAIQAANEALRAVLPTIREIGREFATLPDSVKLGAVGVVGLVTALGPIGEIAQGLPAIKGVFAAIQTGAVLSSVKVLELVGSLKAMGAAQAFATVGAFGLIGGVGALIVAFGASDGPYERITANANKYAQAQIRAALASGDQRAALATLRTDLISIDRNIAALTARQRELDTQRNSSKQPLAETNRLYGETAALLLDQQTRHDGLTKKIRELNEVRKDQKAADEATTVSLTAYSTQVLTGGSATGAFAELTDDAKKSVLDFQSALLASAGGQVGYEQALINIAKAEQELADVRSDPKSSPQEIAEAELALTQARLQGVSAADALDVANKKLVDDILAGTISYDAQKVALLEQIRLHPENAAGYQLEIDKLEQAKRFIDGLPPAVSTKYTFDYDPGPLNAIISQLSQIPGHVVQQAVSFGRLPFGARGGIFTAPYIGGEAGPEAALPLDDPKRSWEIIRQSGLMGNVASAASRPATDVRRDGITFNGPVTFGDRDVLPDLDYFRRVQVAGG